MCKTCINPDDKAKIISLFKALIPQATIYLFGSRTQSIHRPNSDIDIALESGTRLDLLTLAEIKNVLSATNMPYSFDVVDMHHVSQDMLEMIKKQGIEWKS